MALRLLSAARQLMPQLAEASARTGTVGIARRFASTPDDDSHDDFKPQVKAGPSGSAADQIQEDIKRHSVFLYMKGVPEAPQCGFSNMACRILDAYDVEYSSRNVLTDQEIREGVKQFTSWPTIPQIFINGEFVGGSDILMQMHQSGELRKLLVKENKD